MISPSAMRAMRAAVGWSMRDLADAAGVALATVLKAEQGGAVAITTERKIRGAFNAMGVTVRNVDAGLRITVRSKITTARKGVPSKLSGLPYVSFRPRQDGTFRVLFEVPARLRPAGWPSTRPLPAQKRRGNLEDPDEVARIVADAKRLLSELEKARLVALHTVD